MIVDNTILLCFYVITTIAVVPYEYRMLERFFIIRGGSLIAVVRRPYQTLTVETQFFSSQ